MIGSRGDTGNKGVAGVNISVWQVIS